MTKTYDQVAVPRQLLALHVRTIYKWSEMALFIFFLLKFHRTHHFIRNIINKKNLKSGKYVKGSNYAFKENIF